MPSNTDPDHIQCGVHEHPHSQNISYIAKIEQVMPNFLVQAVAA